MFLWHTFYYCFIEEETGAEMWAVWSWPQSFRLKCWDLSPLASASEAQVCSLVQGPERARSHEPDWVMQASTMIFICILSGQWLILRCRKIQAGGTNFGCLLGDVSQNADAQAPLLVHWAASLGWEGSSSFGRKLLADSDGNCHGGPLLYAHR